MFALNSDIDDIALRLGELFDALIKSHGGTIRSSQYSGKEAQNDDLNNKQFRAVAIRQGQGVFRQSLLEAYEERGVITGWAPIEVLDAYQI